MRTIQVDAATAVLLIFGIYSGEVQFSGRSDANTVVVTYGYFVDAMEVLEEEAMRPELSAAEKRIFFRQTPEQIIRAKSLSANFRASVISPERFHLEGSLSLGVLSVRQVNGGDLSMNAGTVYIDQCHGSIKTRLESGTLKVAGLCSGENHRLQARQGTIELHAGKLLGLVEASVDQGMITGKYLGKLERVGMTGWHLYPAASEPDTSVICNVGSGTITLSEG